MARALWSGLQQAMLARAKVEAGHVWRELFGQTCLREQLGQICGSSFFVRVAAGPTLVRAIWSEVARAGQSCSKPCCRKLFGQNHQQDLLAQAIWSELPAGNLGAGYLVSVAAWSELQQATLARAIWSVLQRELLQQAMSARALW